MTKKTKRQHYEETLRKLKDKLAEELAKPQPSEEQIELYRSSIESVKENLATESPELDKPYGFNWDAV
jgi:chromosome segregation ATPase